MPRKDFKFFWIFKKLFVLLNGVFTTRKLRLPGVFTTGESSLPCVFITGESWIHRGVNLNLFLKKLVSEKYSRESRHSHYYYIEESWLPGLFVTIKLFCKPVLMLVPNTPRSRLPGVFITGESRLHDVFTTGESRLPDVFTTRESRLPSVFITGVSFRTLGSRFTYFKEHITIFKGTIILKIDCRLL